MLSTSLYVGGFLVVALWEMIMPRREWTVPTLRRWSNNFALFITSASATYLFIPVLTVGFSQIVSAKGWGLFNVLGYDGVWVVVTGIIILDFIQYLEHRMVHQVPILWRLHRIHHADFDYDVTTGFRFHPVEGIFSICWRMGMVALFGIPVAAVMLAELLLISTNYFVHGNARLPLGLDRVLRKVIVTPDLHRVHHSIDKQEANSNYGSIFSFWDRLLGTYVAQPAAGHENMVIGQHGFRDPKHMNLHWMLINPVLKADADAARHTAQQVGVQVK